MPVPNVHIQSYVVHSNTHLYMWGLFSPDGVHASQADIKLNGRTSKVNLEVVSMKKKIDFRNLLQIMRTILKELEGPRPRD